MSKKKQSSGGPFIRNANMVGAQNDLNNYAVRDEAGKKQWADSVRQQQAAAVDRIKAIAQKNQTNSVQYQSQNQTIKP